MTSHPVPISSGSSVSHCPHLRGAPCPVGSSKPLGVHLAEMRGRECHGEPVLHCGNAGCPCRDEAAGAVWAVAPGSAPPPAHPRGLFLPLPGPAAFPRATHVCRAPRAVLPSWRGSSEQGGIPLARKQPRGWGWMRHSGLGYPVPARCCCLSWPQVAPGSPALPRAHPTIPAAWSCGSWECSFQQLGGCWGDIISALSGTSL